MTANRLVVATLLLSPVGCAPNAFPSGWGTEPMWVVGSSSTEATCETSFSNPFKASDKAVVTSRRGSEFTLTVIVDFGEDREFDHPFFCTVTDKSSDGVSFSCPPDERVESLINDPASRPVTRAATGLFDSRDSVTITHTMVLGGEPCPEGDDLCRDTRPTGCAMTWSVLHQVVDVEGEG